MVLQILPKNKDVYYHLPNVFLLTLTALLFFLKATLIALFL
jgi:hypothetical protein